MMPHVGWLLHGRQTEHGLEITGQPLQPFGQQTFTGHLPRLGSVLGTGDTV